MMSFLTNHEILIEELVITRLKTSVPLLDKPTRISSYPHLTTEDITSTSYSSFRKRVSSLQPPL